MQVAGRSNFVEKIILVSTAIIQLSSVVTGHEQPTFVLAVPARRTTPVRTGTHASYLYQPIGFSS
jgi:hypothetical protein